MGMMLIGKQTAPYWDETSSQLVPGPSSPLSHQVHVSNILLTNLVDRLGIQVNELRGRQQTAWPLNWRGS